MDSKARLIAFYLPQFHPIPENDKYWGKGFTEWTSVAKAKPLYKGHYQPHIPADLGFYDLRLPEIREAQAKMAKEAGVEGFCYWHYWMGKGKMLLERPFLEVLKSGKPDFPFCLGWANGSWDNKTWTKGDSFKKDITIVEQYYSIEDYKDHFMFALDAFKDDRYIKVDGKPLFYIHEPLFVPHMKEFIAIWQDLAIQNGLKGIYFVGRANSFSFWHIDDNGNKTYNKTFNLSNPYKNYQAVLDFGFDAVNSRGLARATVIVGGLYKRIVHRAIYKLLKVGHVQKLDHKKIVNHMYIPEDSNDNVFPTIIPNWDRSPREGTRAVIDYNCTPKVFEENVKLALDLVKNKPDQQKIIFLQAWNEWGEGNHVEPDLKYGHGYLDVLKKYFKNE